MIYASKIKFNIKFYYSNSLVNIITAMIEDKQNDMTLNKYDELEAYILNNKVSSVGLTNEISIAAIKNINDNITINVPVAIFILVSNFITIQR